MSSARREGGGPRRSPGPPGGGVRRSAGAGRLRCAARRRNIGRGRLRSRGADLLRAADVARHPPSRPSRAGASPRDAAWWTSRSAASPARAGRPWRPPSAPPPAPLVSRTPSSVPLWSSAWTLGKKECRESRRQRMANARKRRCVSTRTSAPIAGSEGEGPHPLQQRLAAPPSKRRKAWRFYRRSWGETASSTISCLRRLPRRGRRTTLTCGGRVGRREISRAANPPAQGASAACPLASRSSACASRQTSAPCRQSAAN